MSHEPTLSPHRCVCARAWMRYTPFFHFVFLFSSLSPYFPSEYFEQLAVARRVHNTTNARATADDARFVVVCAWCFTETFQLPANENDRTVNTVRMKKKKKNKQHTTEIEHITRMHIVEHTSIQKHTVPVLCVKRRDTRTHITPRMSRKIGR